jgi:hypothetical protein
MMALAKLAQTGRGRKPGPKGPSYWVIDAFVEMKERNPRYGYSSFARKLIWRFRLGLDKDTVRCSLAVDYKPYPSNGDPSWLMALGHAKDSL